MRRTVFKSKIHRATVTDGNLNYEGSLSIDRDLLDAADILPNEQIHVWDVTNGTRLITYALAAERGSGQVCVNGAGAHLIKKGNLVIIATFTEMRTKEAKRYEPTVVFVDDANKIKELPGDAADVPAEKPSNGTVAHETADEEAVVTAPAKRTRRK
jgi:aspartate 1-decarboxylase